MVGFEEMRDELLERIEDLLKRKQYTALRDLLADLEPADIASLFEDLDEDSIPLLFRLLPKEPAAEVFVELDPDAQEMLIRGFSNTELKEVLDELYLGRCGRHRGGNARERRQAHLKARGPRHAPRASTKFSSTPTTARAR